MRIIVLSEAKTNNNLKSELGLSYYIEHDDTKILFDTGASELYRNNANELGVDLDKIDMVVLSHGHFDHGNGLRFLKHTTLVCHPECFVKRYHKDGFRNLGLDLSKPEIQKRFNLLQFKEPHQISKTLFFLGEIPRINDFESQTTPYIIEGGTEDFVIDDSGLACITGEGLVVLSGCAHSGICNMIEHAINVTGVSEIRAVLGGFHLSRIDYRTNATIDYLKRINAKQVMPSHCTMEPALSVFYKTFGRNMVMVGQELVLDS